MGLPVLIIGKSGSGKSTSMRNYQPGEIALINVLGKPLPFKSQLKSYITDNYAKVEKALDKSTVDTIIIDDAGYLMTNMFMNGHSTTGAGNAVFGFYNSVADNFWALIQYVINKLPPQKIVYFIMHEESTDENGVKPKTIGKLLDEKVCVEGMFAVVLRSIRENGRHFFLTKARENEATKTPIGMFENEEIDNDLKLVDTAIREYYELGGSETNAETTKL